MRFTALLLAIFSSGVLAQNGLFQNTTFPQTFDAFLPSNFSDLLALAKFRPGYVPFETLRAVPLDAEHAASFEYSQKLTPPEGFLHTLRTYYFSLALLANGFPSGTPGVPQISFEELNRRLYHTCLLHDLGWTMTPEGRAHPAHAMTFELHGAFMAYEYLHNAAPDLDAHQVGDIVESIVLHTSEWASGMSSAVKTLLTLTANFDIFGYNATVPGPYAQLLNRQTVAEVEKEYPRGSFVNDLKVIFDREFALKPDCLVSHFPGGRDIFFQDMAVGDCGTGCAWR
ncbi:hypothetical protein B0H15DRAFT_474944 [Mycena belliarum]|uniref:HD domain-containing protein n=1 Tax=Mycena belliarum TaxID=1033014 RepID=A0AAD6XQM1_9AGAR|nr:hypothetical protein B0H15DRAFT_474944 [Mycena belliae]